MRSQEQMDHAVDETLRAFGRLDIVSANAGILSKARLHAWTDEMWDDVLAVNAKGVWHTIKAAAPQMIEQRDGAIVVTASISGFEAAPEYVHYGASKHAAISIMRTAALGYPRYGVRVNAVCPSFVDTTMTDWPGAREQTTVRRDGSREEQLRGGTAEPLWQRGGALTPDPVAAAVVWLASTESKDISGVALPVDAGHMILPGVNGDPVFADDLS